MDTSAVAVAHLASLEQVAALAASQVKASELAVNSLVDQLSRLNQKDNKQAFNSVQIQINTQQKDLESKRSALAAASSAVLEYRRTASLPGGSGDGKAPQGRKVEESAAAASSRRAAAAAAAAAASGRVPDRKVPGLEKDGHPPPAHGRGDDDDDEDDSVVAPAAAAAVRGRALKTLPDPNRESPWESVNSAIRMAYPVIQMSGGQCSMVEMKAPEEIKQQFPNYFTQIDLKPFLGVVSDAWGPAKEGRRYPMYANMRLARVARADLVISRNEVPHQKLKLGMMPMQTLAMAHPLIRVDYNGLTDDEAVEYTLKGMALADVAPSAQYSDTADVRIKPEPVAVQYQGPVQIWLNNLDKPVKANDRLIYKVPRRLWDAKLGRFVPIHQIRGREMQFFPEVEPWRPLELDIALDETFRLGHQCWVGCVDEVEAVSITQIADWLSDNSPIQSSRDHRALAKNVFLPFSDAKNIDPNQKTFKDPTVTQKGRQAIVKHSAVRAIHPTPTNGFLFALNRAVSLQNFYANQVGVPLFSVSRALFRTAIITGAEYHKFAENLTKEFSTDNLAVDPFYLNWADAEKEALSRTVSGFRPSGTVNDTLGYCIGLLYLQFYQRWTIKSIAECIRAGLVTELSKTFATALEPCQPGGWFHVWANIVT